MSSESKHAAGGSVEPGEAVDFEGLQEDFLRAAREARGTQLGLWLLVLRELRLARQTLQGMLAAQCTRQGFIPPRAGAEGLWTGKHP